MRVLVTGGAGFIGSNFLLSSVKERPDTHFVNLDCLTYAANLQNLASIASLPNYEFSRTDLTDGARVAEVVSRVKPDVIFHFAAESHVDRSILGPGAFVQANVVGTFHLLEAARKLESEVLFHHVSTDEVYGSLGQEGLFTEQTPYDPSSPYSASKAASDHLVRAYHRTYGLRVRITNCSNNYGPYQFPEKLIPLVIQNALQKKPLPIYGKGENIRDWLYVGDHCSALWAVHEKGQMGHTYNIGGNNECTNLELVKKICVLLAERTPVSAQEYLDLITFVKDRPGHDMRYAIDATKLRAECGWEPKETVETGLMKTIDWYLENPDFIESVRSGSYQTWIEQNYGGRTGAP